MKCVISGLAIILCIFNSFAFGSPQNKTITISYPKAGWAPYLLVNDNNNKGIMIDVLSIITDQLGYKLLIQPLPTKRTSMYLEIGGADCRPKAREWVDNPDEYYWTDSIVTSEDIFIFRKGDFANINTAKDIEQSNIKVVGTILGYKYPSLETVFSTGKVSRHDIKSTPLLIHFLNLKRADVIISNKFVAEWVIKNDKRLTSNMFRFSPPIAAAEFRFQCSNNHDWKPFILQFNKELAKMRADGRLQEILDKYLK